MKASVTAENAMVHPQRQRFWRGCGAASMALIASICFLACYGRTFVLPHTPILFWGDQLLYATNGARMVSGQMPYRDFFEFLPAGTDLVYAFLFRLFGVRLWIPNLLMDVLATAAVLLTTLAGATVLRGLFRIVPGLLAIGFGLYGGLDATHHWFSTVAALGAMAVLLRGTGTKRIVLAGALCGVAAAFTQSKGAAVTMGFAVYLAARPAEFHQPMRARWTRCLLLCGSAGAAFLAFNLHFMLAIGLKEWCRWVVIFPLRYYATMPGQRLGAPLIDFHSHHGAMRWIGAGFVYVLLPLTYGVFLWSMRKTRRSTEEISDRLFLIWITGVAMLLSISGSLSLMRASAACFPATILLGWYLQGLPKKLKWLTPAVAAAAAMCAFALVSGTQKAHWYQLDLPGGETAIREPGKYDLYRWLKEHTHPGEDYFGIAPISLPLGLRCPAPIQQPGPWEYYRPEHIARSIAALEERRVPLLVLRPYPQFEDTRSYDATRLHELDKYVEMHYRLIRLFSTGDQGWERKTGEIQAGEDLPALTRRAGDGAH